MPGPDTHPNSPTIVPLGQCPHVTRTLAEWHYGKWGWMNPARDVDHRVARFEAHMRTGQVPTTFVALVGGDPVGSASLIESDMDSRPALTPWLASVFVDPDHRRRGIASRLVDRVVAEAATIGIERVYLFTPDQMNLYASLGWTEVEKVEYRGEVETIMTIRPLDRVVTLRR